VEQSDRSSLAFESSDSPFRQRLYRGPLKPPEHSKASWCAATSASSGPSGLPDKFIANVTDPLLQDCIEALGANADFPSVDQLEAVLPGLVSRHGVGAVRLMLAGAVLGEAPAVMAISKVLKTSPTLAVLALP
jgi:hypothetical protein